MLPVQMSLHHLDSVLYVPTNLPLKFGQNRVSKGGDIADIEFVWGGVGWWGGWGLHSHFRVQPPTTLRLRCG